MTVQVRLIPSSGAEVPAKAKDHGLLASWLESNGDPPSTTPAGGWRGVERVVAREYVELRLPGTLADYSSTTLDGLTSAITSNAAVEAHPDGWQEVSEP